MRQAIMRASRSRVRTAGGERLNILRQAVRSSANESKRTRSISAAIGRSTACRSAAPFRNGGRNDCAFMTSGPLAGSLSTDPVHPLACGLVGHQVETQLLADHCGEEAADRVRLPPGGI